MKNYKLTADGWVRRYDEVNNRNITSTREVLEVELDHLEKIRSTYGTTEKWKRQWMEAQTALNFLSGN